MAKKRLKLFVFILFFMLAFVSVSQDVFAYDPIPNADLINAPSQIGPAETFNVEVALENDGFFADGCGGGFALLTDKAAFTGQMLGGFSSKTIVNTKWAEWYKSNLPWYWPSDRATATATIKSPNFKDAQSFTLQHRGWLRSTNACTTSTNIFRDPTLTSAQPTCTNGLYKCYSKTVNVVKQNPIVTLGGVPDEIEAGKEFTVTIELKELGWQGYDGAGMHLRVENGVIKDTFNKGDFLNYFTEANFIEFYPFVQSNGVSLPLNSVKKATVPIKAGSVGTLKIYYRAWTRDKGGFFYRDPDDVTYPDGASSNSVAKTPLQWTAYPKTVTVKEPAGCTVADFVAPKDEPVDVSATMNQCSFSGKYELKILKSQPRSATFLGDFKKTRAACTVIVPGWQDGNEFQNMLCPNNNKWYWVEYPAVLNGVPKVDIGDAKCSVDAACTFVALASDPDGDSLSYSWDFGDFADSIPATGRIVSHVYSQAGTFPLKVTVKDSSATASDTATVTVIQPNVNLRVRAEDIEIK